jgi:hypothetical protein
MPLFFYLFLYYYVIHYFGCNLFILDVDCRVCITWIIHQLWGCNVEEKLHLGVRDEKSLNTTGLDYVGSSTSHIPVAPPPPTTVTGIALLYQVSCDCIEHNPIESDCRLAGLFPTFRGTRRFIAVFTLPATRSCPERHESISHLRSLEDPIRY